MLNLYFAYTFIVFWHIRLHFLENHDIENSLALNWPFLKNILFYYYWNFSAFFLTISLYFLTGRGFQYWDPPFYENICYRSGRSSIFIMEAETGFIKIPVSLFLNYCGLKGIYIEGLGMAVFFRHLWVGYIPRLGNQSGRLNHNLI